MGNWPFGHAEMQPGWTSRQKNWTDWNAETVTTDGRGRGVLGMEYANSKVNVLVEPDNAEAVDEQPYHAIHKISPLPDQVRTYLWQNGYVVMHWGPEPYTGEWYYEQLQEEYHNDDSEKDRNPHSDYRAFDTYARAGGVHTLRDREYEPSDGPRLMRISYSSPYKELRAFPYRAPETGELHYLKGIQADFSFVVTDEECEKLFQGTPRHATIQRWKSEPEKPRDVFKDLMKERPEDRRDHR